MFRRDIGEIGDDINHPNHRGGCLNALCLLSNLRANLRKEIILKYLNLILGVQDLRFPFLKFRSDKPLRVRQRLLADIIVGNEVGDLI